MAVNRRPRVRRDPQSVGHRAQRGRFVRRLGGGFAMGLGIWSMHFVGMLAFSLPIRLGYDLGITLAILAAAGSVPAEAVARVAHIGELGLDGEVRSVPGVLPAVIAARAAGLSRVVVPAAAVVTTAAAVPVVVPSEAEWAAHRARLKAMAKKAPVRWQNEGG